jgi:hypothetical protein
MIRACHVIIPHFVDGLLFVAPARALYAHDWLTGAFPLLKFYFKLAGHSETVILSDCFIQVKGVDG